MNRHNRLRRAAALTVALAALTAPSAFAQQDLRSPDARDAARPAASTQDLRSPDARDAAVARPSLTVAAKPAAPGGSGWSAVTLGGLGLLAALVCAGTVVLVRRKGDGAATAVADGIRGWRSGVGL